MSDLHLDHENKSLQSSLSPVNHKIVKVDLQFSLLLLGFLIKPDKCFTCISWGWGRCSWNTRGERSFTCSILDCCSFNINSEALWTPWKNEQKKKTPPNAIFIYMYTQGTLVHGKHESQSTCNFKVKISSNQDVTSLAKLYGT